MIGESNPQLEFCYVCIAVVLGVVSASNGLDVSTVERQAEYWSATDCVSILVTGRSSSGKHYLVRGLLGKASQHSSYSNIPQSKIFKRGICFRVSFWSLPELNDAEYWNAVKKMLRNLDLVVYAVRLDDIQLGPEDVYNLRRLTREFGERLWEKAMVALTFANRVTYLNERQVVIRSKAFSKSRANRFRTRISNILTEEGRVTRAVVNNLPVVPAGHLKEARLFEGEEPWASQILRCAIIRLNGTGSYASGALWTASKHRVQLSPDPSTITCHQ